MYGKKSIFNEIADWRNKNKERVTNAQVQKASRLRSDKTNADEARIILNIILFVAEAITAYMGFLYYKEAYESNLSPMFGAIMALGVAVTVEIAKVFLVRLALRSILFRWIVESWSQLGYWAFVFILAVSSYIWSYTISTDGMEMFVKNNQYKSRPKDDLQQKIAAATAGIDAQINQESSARSASEQTKWKGTTTIDAQRSIRKNNSNIESLLAQKQKIVDDITAKSNAGNAESSNIQNSFTSFIKKFGGYMEIICALCLIALAFAEMRLVEVVSSDPNASPTPEPQPVSNPQPQPQPQPKFNNHNPTYFNRGSDGNVVSFSNNPVAQSDTAVPHDAPHMVSVGSDGVLRDAITRIKRDMANLKNENGNPLSVYNRIASALTSLHNATKDKNFDPDESLAHQAYAYLYKDVFPELEAFGFDFPKYNELMHALYPHTHTA